MTPDTMCSPGTLPMPGHQRPAATPLPIRTPRAAEAAHFELLTGALLVAGLRTADRQRLRLPAGFLAHTLLSPTLRLLPLLQVVLIAGRRSPVGRPAGLAGAAAACGYRVALDGCRSLEPGLLPLLPDLDFLRLDAAALGAAALAPLLQSLRGAGFHGVAIATGIAMPEPRRPRSMPACSACRDRCSAGRSRSRPAHSIPVAKRR